MTKLPRWLRDQEEPPPAPVERSIRFVLVRRDENGELIRGESRELGEAFTPKLGETDLPPLVYSIGGRANHSELRETEALPAQPLETPQETRLESVEPVTVEDPKEERRVPVSGTDVAELWRYDRRTKPTVPGLWSWVSTSMFRDRGYWHDFEKGSPRGGSFMDPRGE